MKDTSAGDITVLLRRLGAGERGAESELLEAFYPTLKRLARAKMRSERATHTFQPTALVHEAYLKLFDGKELSFENRRHFYAVMATAMNHVLIDYARKHGARKGPGRFEKEPIDSRALVDVQALDLDRLLDMARAMEELEAVDPRACQVARLRHYLGMTFNETAEELGLAERTARRDWAFARAFLLSRIEGRRANRAAGTS